MLPTIFVLIGLCLILLGIYVNRRARQHAQEMLTWPAIDGRVLAAGVVKRESNDTDGGTTYYDVMAIQYAYSVGGSEYQGRYENASRKRFAELTARYPATAPVKVSYDPKHPGKSGMELTGKQTSQVALLCFIAGPIFMFIGAVLFVN